VLPAGQVLLLDSDNLPLVDPSWVFQDALYLRHSNLFWPDYWSNWVKPGVFPWLGLNRSVVQVWRELREGSAAAYAVCGLK
jgi:hypothetical protein